LTILSERQKVSKFRLSHLAKANTVAEPLVQVSRQTSANCASRLLAKEKARPVQGIMDEIVRERRQDLTIGLSYGILK
jgi:hypothetical protein